MEICSRPTSWRSFGSTVTSCVKATAHHSWKRTHLALVLALARAVLAAAEQQHHGVVALELRQPARHAVLVGQLEVGQGRAGGQARCSSGVSLWQGRMPGTASRIR